MVKTMKALKGFITILICLAVISAATVFVAAEGSYIRGDANSDGKVTIRDVTTVQLYMVGKVVSGFKRNAADVDGKGIDINDATYIQLYLVGKNNTYHIGETVSDSNQSTSEEYELPYLPY